MTHIVTGLSLPIGLLLGGAIVFVALGSAWLGSDPIGRRGFKSRLRAGLVTGLISTIAYDGSKYFLSRCDPSPYNPFEAIRVFGTLLVPNGSTLTVRIAGAAFHILNGVSFGVGFCFLFRKPSVIVGISWGFFLEVFQLTLYPGWLSIRFYSEFVQISAISHAVYGSCLGFIGSRLIHDREAAGFAILRKDVAT